MSNEMLKEWLEKWGHTYVKPIRVTIEIKPNKKKPKTIVCEGAEFFSKIFEDTRLMLLTGDYDLITNRKCFTRDDHEKEWFVAGYATPELAQKQPDANPFGPSVMVCAYFGDNKIDQYEKKPYTRLPMKVEYL